MSDSGSGKGGYSSLAVFVLCVLIFMISCALVADYREQVVSTHQYVIPKFLIDMFIEACRWAMGAGAVVVLMSGHLAAKKVIEKKPEAACLTESEDASKD